VLPSIHSRGLMRSRPWVSLAELQAYTPCVSLHSANGCPQLLAHAPRPPGVGWADGSAILGIRPVSLVSMVWPGRWGLLLAVAFACLGTACVRFVPALQPA